MPRDDDFQARRRHLAGYSDEELHGYFWSLAERIVAPLVADARTHTSPSIERSVLLRMGFSSIEAKALVAEMSRRGVLAHGAGRLVLSLARRRRMAVRAAGLALLAGEHWQELGPGGAPR